MLRLLARGQTNLEIAHALVVREGTIKYHVKNILRKLGATSRADAVSRYARAGGSVRGMSARTLPRSSRVRSASSCAGGSSARPREARELLGVFQPSRTADGGDGRLDLEALRALIAGLRSQLPEDELAAGCDRRAGGGARAAAPPVRDPVRGARAGHGGDRRAARGHLAARDARCARRRPCARGRRSNARSSAWSRVGGWSPRPRTSPGQDRAAATTLAQLQANPLRLEHTLIETELLRRRRATIVVDARRPSPGRPRDGPPHGVAVVRGRAAGRRLAGGGRDPRRPRPRPAARRARPRRPVGVRHRTRPGIREHQPAPHAARRARPDAPVPRLAGRALERADRRAGDAVGRRPRAAAPPAPLPSQSPRRDAGATTGWCSRGC